MMRVEYSKLIPLLPEGTASLAISWLESHQPDLALSFRKSHRLGFFCIGSNPHQQKISLNLNQSPLSLLLTLVHEIAHMKVYHRYGRGVAPHGKEWKTTNTALLNEIVDKAAISPEVLHVVKMVAQNPSASKFSKVNISRALLLSDANGSISPPLLCDIAPGTRFRLPDGKVFIKGELVRTRYRCKLERSSKVFLVAGCVPVEV